MWFRKIQFDNIQFVTFKKVEKERKKSLFPLFSEMPSSKWFIEPDYVYNNGAVFVVEFHLKNQQIEKSYYTWLYKTKSTKRVERQKTKLEQFVSNMNCIIHQK